jgi:PAS domain S-box-containing protein
MKQSIDITPVVSEGRYHCLLQVRDVTETVRREALLKQQSRQLRLDLQRLSRAQVELQRSEMRFRELARQAPAGLFEADAQACCTFLNERCEQILGHDLEHVAGTPWINLLPVGEQARVRAIWCVAAESATRFAEEFRYTRPDGESRWMRAEAGPQRDEHGRISGFIGTMLDVTEFHERAIRNEFRANHDGLTSLLNRDRFERHLRAAISGAREVADRLACCSSIWTTSRASTTPMATMPVTPCSRPSRPGCAGCCAARTWWPATVATSLPCCSRAPTTVPPWRPLF